MLKKYQEIRKRTTDICAPLKVEDYVPQIAVHASPPKWHLAHTTWFFEEMILTKQIPDYKVFDPEFGFLFNSYYQSLGDRLFRAERGHITRPGVEEVYAYRNYIDKYMHELLSNSDLSSELMEVITLGLNHEQQHQELLITDLKLALAHNPIFPIYKQGHSLTSGQNLEEGWHKQKEGLYKIGHDSDNFSFDNEHGRHTVFLHEFEISKSLVTNGDFIEFMEAGGYDKFQYWLDEGWSWVSENNVKSPLYWHKVDDQWHNFTLSGLLPIDPDAILCHVSFYEANAFAAWKGMRLPTEFEWEVVSDQINWGQRWEWTNSAYLPYPNFKIKEGAVGEYNGKFMVNQMILRGGSVATALGHSRKTYRNFFHPHFQWQFSGIRLVKTL